MTSKEFKFHHNPVLLTECIEALKIKEDGIYVDCTTGGGGHSLRILESLGRNGILICLDKDSEALKAADIKLEGADTKGRYQLIKSDFSEIAKCLHKEKIDKVDGILADFGVSSYQLDENIRGFGYMQDGPLDMRMDLSSKLNAMVVVNKYPEKDLERILFTYGEERYSKRIVSAIIRQRDIAPITTTKQLSDIISASLPAQAKREQQHPAKRTFQAIRIEVNRELESITELMSAMPGLLNEGGRFAAISFHSLEDRIVKDAIRELENPCKCPKSFPVCNCGKTPIGRAINKKPITATLDEIEENPRARSAKLRIFEKY